MQRLEQLTNTELFELLGDHSMESVMAQEILDNRMEKTYVLKVILGTDFIESTLLPELI